MKSSFAVAQSRSRAAAEAFVARDPFVLEGLIASYEIRHWADQTLV